MKKGIHPENYRPVVFKDMSNGDVFLSRSTVNTKETIEFEGETYPLVKLEISSTSHPFYTGKSKLVDTAGRVDKFMSRYGNRKNNLFFLSRKKGIYIRFPFLLLLYQPLRNGGLTTTAFSLRPRMSIQISVPILLYSGFTYPIPIPTLRVGDIVPEVTTPMGRLHTLQS